MFNSWQMSAYKGVEMDIYSVFFFLDFCMFVMLIEKQCSNQKWKFTLIES